MRRRATPVPLSPAGRTVLALDKTDDSLFLVDSVGVRRVSSDGSVATVKLKGAFRLTDVESVTCDGTGSLYLTQKGNHAIFKITIIRNEGVMHRVAGQERSFGYRDSSWADRTKARFFRGYKPKNDMIPGLFNWPKGVAATEGGTLYVADCGNNLVRCISPAGIVTTLAGVPPRSTSKGTKVTPELLLYDPSDEFAASSGKGKKPKRVDSDGDPIEDEEAEPDPATLAMEGKDYAKVAFKHPVALAIGGTDHGLYVIDMSWNVRKLLNNRALIVVALASYVDAALVPVEHSAVGRSSSAAGGAGKPQRKTLRGLPPRPSVSRLFPAPYVRYLQHPNCLTVDGQGNMYVGVWLPSSVGMNWINAANVGPRGLSAGALKIEAPGRIAAGTPYLPKSKLLAQGVPGSSAKFTSCVVDASGCVFWAQPGAPVLQVTDPYPRWRFIGGYIMLRYLYLTKRTNPEVIPARRQISAQRQLWRTMQWCLMLPEKHERAFRTIFSFVD